MLFSVIDADLAHAGSGGDVADFGGNDILFVGLDPATRGGPSSCNLTHEIGTYDDSSREQENEFLERAGRRAACDPSAR